MARPTIVIGTSNPGKVAEIKRFLGDLPVDWQPTTEAELGLTIREDADTFEENAKEKALAFAKATGKSAIAGDGGLEILALGGWPGLRTRRLDSEHRKTDEELIAVMSDKIRSLAADQREYRFVTVFVFATPNGSVTVGRGEHTGQLRETMHEKSEPGFPNRRFWFIPVFDKYFYDLTPEEYNEINHNRMAFDQLRPAIEAYIKEQHA